MKFNPDYHHRHSIRLAKYDYSQSGIYFITICTYQKQCLFGKINQGKMELNQIGKIVAQQWLNSEKIRQEIELDQWIIMPNHLHGIVIITKDNKKIFDVPKPWNPTGNILVSRKPRSLSSFVSGFKAAVSKKIKAICTQSTPCVWQRNFHESIVRNDQQLNKIRQYIINNPQTWAEDTEKPENEEQEFLIDFKF